MGCEMKVPRQARMILRERFEDDRGTELAESAMVLPLLFVVIIAIFWFGQAFRTYSAISHAAREGARAAVAPGCATCGSGTVTVAAQDTAAVQNAVTAVNSALTAARLDPNQVQLPSPIPSFPGCNGGPAVNSCYPAITNPASNVCVEFNVQLSSNTSGGAGSCGTSVSFSYKYPIHFTLPCWPSPCTSLDLSTMALPARSQMHAETQ